MSKKIIREETETTHSSVADIQQPSHIYILKKDKAHQSNFKRFLYRKEVLCF